MNRVYEVQYDVWESLRSGYTTVQRFQNEEGAIAFARRNTFCGKQAKVTVVSKETRK